jgi:hypothetical protein
MPLELSVWRIDSGLSRVEPSTMDLEARLEDILARDIGVASPDWMVIGRQVPTPWDKKIDLLCIDLEGNLVLLELKRDKTEREIVAQVLDYGSYVRVIQAEEIPRIYAKYQKDYFSDQPPKSIDDAFCARFHVKQMPEELNAAHELVIVASTLDPATERIVGYLAEQYQVNINAVFFQVFKDGDREYLTRAWLRDPMMAEESARRTTATAEKVELNGEYYVNFGETESRVWEDARKYGFVSAGWGHRFRQAMERLEPKNRIWVNIPGGVGYVGVGIVEDAALPVDKFMVKNEKGESIPILQAPLKATDMGHSPADQDNMEWLVRVKWLKTVAMDQAVRERGFFGNQNCVVEPRDKRWPFTIERLKQHFGIHD